MRNSRNIVMKNGHAGLQAAWFALLLLLVLVGKDFLYTRPTLHSVAFNLAISVLLWGTLVAAFRRVRRLTANSCGIKDHVNSIINNSEGMVWAIDTNYCLLAFNDAFFQAVKQTCGYECRLGDNLLQLPCGNKNPEWEEHYNTALSGAAFSFLWEERIPGQESLYFQNTLQPLKSYDTGKILGVCCYSKDETEVIRQEKKLRESNEKLKAALEIGNMGFWEFDCLSEALLASDNFFNMLGYDKDEINPVGQRFGELINTDDYEQVSQTFEEQMVAGGRIDLNFRMIARNGQTLWFRCTGSILEWTSEGYPRKVIGTFQNFTTQKLHEESLKRLSLVASKTHNGVVITGPDAKIEWANEAYERITGYTLSEIIGQSPALFNGPDTDPGAKKRINEGLQAKKIVREEILYYKKSGEQLWMLVEITPIFDNDGNLEHFISIETDISDKRRQESKRILLESAVGNSAEAILIISKKCTQNTECLEIEYANNAFFDMTGHEPSEVLSGNPVRFLQGPAITEHKIVDMFSTALSEGYTEEELKLYKKNGEQFWIDLAVSPVCATEYPSNCHFVAIVRDINEKKLAQNERDNLTREVLKRNEELQEFAQIVSHNLRAPVVNILGLTQIFDNSQAFSDYNKNIMNLLVEATRRLDTILIDLNQILQVRDSSHELMQVFKLRELVEQVHASMTIQVRESAAKINIDIDPLVEMKTVRGYMHSVIHNLINNALKYRHPNRPLQVDVLAYTTTSHMVIMVKDNGLGMNLNQVRDKLFKLYKRFHSHVEGKGMGLFLVKSQVERMGGDIRVYSTLEKGTVFRIIIPVSNFVKQGLESQLAELDSDVA